MSKIYKTIISVADNIVPTPLRPLWNHPAGKSTARNSETEVKKFVI